MFEDKDFIYQVDEVSETGSFTIKFPFKVTNLNKASEGLKIILLDNSLTEISSVKFEKLSE